MQLWQSSPANANLVGGAHPTNLVQFQTLFPIIQNPTSMGVFWTTGWNLRSEVVKSFVSNFVPVVSWWNPSGLSRGCSGAEFVFCQTSLAGNFSEGEILI
ncbi:MAG: hypothetical protein ACI93T_003643 [Porticoccaceae bacterium]